MTLRCLFVDFNSYFASVEQHDDASLRGRPVAVAPVLSATTCCIAASYEAKAFGIRTGTPVWEAMELCPELVVRDARPARYVAMHHVLMDAIAQDKKVVRGALTFILTRGIGQAFIEKNVEPDVVRGYIDEMRGG